MFAIAAVADSNQVSSGISVCRVPENVAGTGYPQSGSSIIYSDVVADDASWVVAYGGYHQPVRRIEAERTPSHNGTFVHLGANPISIQGAIFDADIFHSRQAESDIVEQRHSLDGDVSAKNADTPIEAFDRPVAHGQPFGNGVVEDIVDDPTSRAVSS